jgi:hypothetical protein
MRVLLMLVASTCCACASTGATPRPFPVPGARPAKAHAGSLPTGGVAPTGTISTTGTMPMRSGGYEISGTALSLRGTPYRNGGADPNGFDCSGLVWYVFAQHGVAVPRTVADQYQSGGEVQSTDLKAGDLVFFSTTSVGASHVGIVVGGDSFVHAPASTGIVRVERLGSSYWSSRFIGARRIF